MTFQFKTAVAAGTFDHFHKGHREFLLHAFSISHTIYIAITNDAFAKASRDEDFIEPFTKRKQIVEKFLEQEKLLGRAVFIELADIYGPTLDTDCPIEAVVVSEKTMQGAVIINNKRKEKGLPPLAIREVALTKAQDGGELSSSRIRSGEIDREGNMYIQKEWMEHDLKLPEALRPLLQKPIGVLLEGDENNPVQVLPAVSKMLQGSDAFLATIGDEVSMTFQKAGIRIDLAIVDFRVKREDKYAHTRELGFTKEPDSTIENPQGTMSATLFQEVKKVKSPYIIRILGEDDLATLAVILFAPLGANIFYGQPGQGIVYVHVTEELKSKVRDIVLQFDKVL